MFKVAVTALCGAGLILVALGMSNLQREYRRTMEALTIVRKLQLGLNLHEAAFMNQLPNKIKAFQKDQGLFPNRWLEEPMDITSDSWIDGKMKICGNLRRHGRSTFYAVFALLFYLLAVPSLIVILLVWVL